MCIRDRVSTQSTWGYGLVLNEDLQWISFQGNYDFAYFLKLVTCEGLPDSKLEFLNKLQIYFPHYYDVKCLLRELNITSGSLSKISSNFGIKRMGIQHQAGSDSVVTAKLFFKLKETQVKTRADAKCHNSLYGFDSDADYDLSSDSPDEEQPFYFAHAGTPGLDNYTDAHPSGLYYGSSYYRTPSPYSVGPYYLPPGFPSAVTQNVYGLYHSES
eukprot:TRINITY_DN1510_c0_g1_i5.p1 TRINITY_DN1510_c0_g1~~TRINITY_DN1510_c0_g1_i5.p1  ORF type:complete len:229 (-),score=51.14 TRINITY_DN1510_c0_g1_i5:86-727(-)